MTKTLDTSSQALTKTIGPKDGFKKEFFKDLYNLESENFWFRNRNRLIIWALKKFFPGAETFLEIGCGTGFVLSGINAAMPHLKLSGSELFEDGLSFAKSRLPNAKLIQLDARHMQHAEDFDVIGAFDVIEHIEEDEQVLQQMYKACRRGIILTVPQHRWLWSELDDYSCHKRRYARDELVKKVESAGFKVAFATSFVFLLLPIMFISRSRKKISSDYDVTSELRLPPILNSVLEKILLVELFLIGNKMILPAGGSLLLIASKPSRVEAPQ